MKSNKIKRLTVNLEEYVVEIAEKKAKLMFQGSLDSYINWLICSNNKLEVKKAVEKLEKALEKNKPEPILDTIKTAMYNNTCDYCGEKIYQGEEICKAQGYSSYIHLKCCKKQKEIPKE